MFTEKELKHIDKTIKLLKRLRTYGNMRSFGPLYYNTIEGALLDNPLEIRILGQQFLINNKVYCFKRDVHKLEEL